MPGVERFSDLMTSVGKEQGFYFYLVCLVFCSSIGLRSLVRCQLNLKVCFQQSRRFELLALFLARDSGACFHFALPARLVAYHSAKIGMEITIDSGCTQL